MAGVVGGSGILDHHIGEYCQEEARLKGVHLTWMDKQNLIEQFRAVKKLLGRGHYIPENRHTLHSREIDIHLTPEIITSVFNGAMRAAFQKCTEAFEICDQANEDRGTQVLVTGGTARSKFLQEKLELMCRKADLDEVIFMEDLLSEQGRYPLVYPISCYCLAIWRWVKLTRSRRHRSLNVAKGAAYANENCMTPAEFLERGAAIGYQMRQAGGPVWNSRAPILCRTEVLPPTLPASTCLFFSCER
ncbi:hypothetical protein IMZ48_25945 [Candidatus Bathyarchaeota archaeon]|nr:hypothetical protein [Candidatus Bathyarchaeota archaeon]